MLRYLKMYYILVALPYLLLLAGSAFFFEPIKRTILNNPFPHLNYAIIVIVLTGGIFILNNARRLVGQARILRKFTEALHAKTDSTTLRDVANRYTGALACILQMVAGSVDRAISHQEQAALEHELANARSRLVRRNALPQYLTGLLVAMGLLGTFIGLLATLADISVLIGSFADIDMNNIDPIQVFRVMIERMKAPMTSMGIAFSTSMFGLLGSIVIGLMMVGIRRLQGDIFSVLSSEVARHIETALSFESISFRGGDASIGCYGEATDLNSKVLLRIEERLAESARVRQRALSAEIDDFKKQRAEMLQVLGEQTQASNNFCKELQQIGQQLGSIFDSMAKSNTVISGQISDLTVQLGGEARETHKLLAAQTEEQKKLREVLDGYKIEEWMAETARRQQRALSAEMEEFKNQRGEMLRTLADQTESSNGLRIELQHLGNHLANILDSMQKGNGEISGQISDLTVHLGADAKESHRLLHITSNNIRNELQQLGNHLGNRLGTLLDASEKGKEEIVSQGAEFMSQVAAEAKEGRQQLGSLSETLRSELKQLGEQLGLVSSAMEKGNDAIASRLSVVSSATEKGSDAIASRLSELKAHMGEKTEETQRQVMERSGELRTELQQLGEQFNTLLQAAEKGRGSIASLVSGLTAQMAAESLQAQQQIDKISGDFRSELKQLYGQLGAISQATETGSGEIAARISELMLQMTIDPEEPEKLLANADE